MRARIAFATPFAVLGYCYVLLTTSGVPPYALRCHTSTVHPNALGTGCRYPNTPSRDRAHMLIATHDIRIGVREAYSPTFQLRMGANQPDSSCARELVPMRTHARAKATGVVSSGLFITMSSTVVSWMFAQ